MKSFESVSVWLQNIQKNAPEETKLILVANKCDLEEKRVVTFEKGEEVNEWTEEIGCKFFYFLWKFKLAKANSIDFFEVSAKEDINISEAFMSLAKSIKDKQEGVVVEENAQQEVKTKLIDKISFIIKCLNISKDYKYRDSW